MKYGYKKYLNVDFHNAVIKTKESLQNEGFGILEEIDVREILKKKLDVDFKNYVILGACNPPNAYKALQTELEIGLMLPCNVIIYQKGDKVYASAILPTVAMSVIENKELNSIAQNIEKKLKKSIDNI